MSWGIILYVQAHGAVRCAACARVSVWRPLSGTVTTHRQTNKQTNTRVVIPNVQRDCCDNCTNSYFQRGPPDPEAEPNHVSYISLSYCFFPSSVPLAAMEQALRILPSLVLRVMYEILQTLVLPVLALT